MYKNDTYVILHQTCKKNNSFSYSNGPIDGRMIKSRLRYIELQNVTH